MSKSNIRLFRDMPNGEAAIERLPHKFLDSLHIDQLESLSRSWSLIARSPEIEAIKTDSEAKIISKATGEEIWYYMNPYEGDSAEAVSEAPHPMVQAAQQISEGFAYQNLSQLDQELDYQRQREYYRRHGREGDNFNVYKQPHYSGFGETHDRHLSTYAIKHEADRRYRRLNGRLDRDTSEYADIKAQVIRERETPVLDMDTLGSLELAPSGNAPELPYPAARISTVSGTIVFNQSFMNRLRSEPLPSLEWVEVSQAKGGRYIVFRFLDQYERGAYKLGVPTMYNRGWSISPKSLISRLVYRKERELRDLGKDGDIHQQAADLVFGRRRLFQVAGTPFWALDLESEIV